MAKKKELTRNEKNIRLIAAIEKARKPVEKPKPKKKSKKA